MEDGGEGGGGGGGGGGGIGGGIGGIGGIGGNGNGNGHGGNGNIGASANGGAPPGGAPPGGGGATQGAESAVAQAWGGNPGAARATGRSIPVRAIHHLHHALDDDSASALAGPTAQGSGAGGLAASGAASASSAGLTMTASAANAAGASGGADLAVPGGNSNASAANTGVVVNAAPLAVPGAGLQGRRSGNPSPVHGRKSPRNSPRTSPMPRTSPAHGRSASPLYTRNSPRASPVAAWPLQTRNKSPHHHSATTSASTGAAAKSAFNKVKPKRSQTVTPQGSNGLVHLGLAQQVGTDDNAAIAAAASSAFTSSSSASSSISSSSSSSSALTSAANSAFAGVGSSGRSLSASAGASGGRRSSSRSPVMVSHNARARLSPSHKAFVTASSTAAANSNQGTQQSANKMASRGPTSPVLMMGPNKSSHQRQDPTSRDIEFLTRGREATGDVFDSGAPADDPGFGSDNELKMYASGPLDENGRRRPPSSSASETGGGFGGTHTGSGGLTTSTRPKSCTGSFARHMTSPTFDHRQQAHYQQYPQVQRGVRLQHTESSESKTQPDGAQQTHGTTTAEFKRQPAASSATTTTSTTPSDLQESRGRNGPGQGGVHSRLRSNSLDSPLRAQAPRRQQKQQQQQQLPSNVNWSANSQTQLQQASARRQQIRLSQQHTLQMQLMEHQHNHQMQQRQLLQQEQQVPQDQSLAPSLAQTQVWGATSEQDRQQNTLADLDGLTLEEVFEYERRLHERKAQLLRERVFASQPQGTTSRQGSEAGSSLRPRVSSNGSMASQEFDSMLENEFLVEPANGPLGSLPHPRDRCDSGNCILDDMDDACVPGTMDFEEGEGFAVEVPDGARAPNVKMFRSCDRSASGYISPGSLAGSVGSATTPLSVDLEGDTVEEIRNKISEGWGKKNLSRSPGNLSFVSSLAVNFDSRPTVARLKSPPSSQLETMRNPIEKSSLVADHSSGTDSLHSSRSAFSRASKPDASAPRGSSCENVRTQRNNNFL